MMITQEEIERDYFDSISAARELNVTDSRIRKLCSEGRFEGALKTGRAWIIPKVSIINFTRLRPKSTKKEPSDKEIWRDVVTKIKKQNNVVT